MSLPLTLAVLDGMVVKVGEQTLVLPLTAIVETMKPKPTDVHAIGTEASVLANRGGFIPIIDVGTELGYRARRVGIRFLLSQYSLKRKVEPAVHL